jgi:hypothetical protein
VRRAVQVLKQTTATQRAVGTAVGGLAAATLVRWQAVLSVTLSPALLVASVAWVLAHESRQSLENDVADLLLFPGRRQRNQGGEGGVETAAPDGYEADGEEDEGEVIAAGSGGMSPPADELLVPPCDDAGGVYQEEFLLWTNQDGEDFSFDAPIRWESPRVTNGRKGMPSTRKGRKHR